MRLHDGAATPPNQQATTGTLLALLLMVVVPALIVAMTRASGPLPQFLLGLAAGLTLVACGTYIFRLGREASGGPSER
jgi:uncharacterized membrane protein